MIFSFLVIDYKVNVTQMVPFPVATNTQVIVEISLTSIVGVRTALIQETPYQLNWGTGYHIHVI